MIISIAINVAIMSENKIFEIKNLLIYKPKEKIQQ